ncbi:MAG TPA: type II toxin-antitoxin system VapC family toxin [Thermoanaerobaculia bacterium]|jgi:predicted nucleic acid-binding protein|nr:type II toxin-antitoxin system VapC family toxin [Thermoanaerobaculia bacterium]
MFLCDTNVVSEFFRPRPSQKLLDWAEGVSEIFVSVVTIEEIQFGLSWRPKPRILGALESFLSERCKLLPITPEIANRSGVMRGSFQARGQTRSVQDMLIAATAEIHQLVLVTRNVDDFAECALTLFNPID